MPKCDLNKVATQLRHHTSAWVLSCKFAAYLQNTLSLEHLLRATSFYKNTSGGLLLKREIPLKITEVKRHAKKETKQKISLFENNLMDATNKRVSLEQKPDKQEQYSRRNCT